MYANNTVYKFTSDAVDGDGCLSISGDFYECGTLNSSGAALTYTLKQYNKANASLFGFDLYDISRNGQEVIDYISTGVSFAPLNNFSLTQQNSPNSGPVENVNQAESISFLVETKNGQKLQGEL